MLNPCQLAELRLNRQRHRLFHHIHRRTRILQINIRSWHNDLGIFFLGGEKCSGQPKDNQGNHQQHCHLGIDEIGRDLPHPISSGGSGRLVRHSCNLGMEREQSGRLGDCQKPIAQTNRARWVASSTICQQISCELQARSVRSVQPHPLSPDPTGNYGHCVRASPQSPDWPG